VARIRTIKPEFWKHEDLCALPESTHMLAGALLNYADDFGYFNANPALVKAECCPLREPSVSIPESLRSLQEIGYIALGTCEKGRTYGRINNFSEHQRVSHPSKSKIQGMTITWEDSGNPPEKFQSPQEILRPEQGKEQGKEGKGEGASRRFVPPSLEQVAAYCNERNNGIDPAAFIAHYEANGWMRGKNKIQDWQACVRTWEGNRKADNKNQQQTLGMVTL
jgi:hypothetical protein